MKKIIEFLDGKKTFIGGGIIFIAGGLKALKAINQEVFEVLIAIGGAIATYGLRSALKKFFESIKK